MGRAEIQQWKISRTGGRVWEPLVYDMIIIHTILRKSQIFPTDLNSYSTGLSQSMSGANWDTARNQSQTSTTATLSYHGNEEHWRRAGPLNYTHRCPGHKHLMEIRKEKQVEMKWMVISATRKYRNTHSCVLHDVRFTWVNCTQQCIELDKWSPVGRNQEEMLSGRNHIQDKDNLQTGTEGIIERGTVISAAFYLLVNLTFH